MHPATPAVDFKFTWHATQKRNNQSTSCLQSFSFLLRKQNLGLLFVFTCVKLKHAMCAEKGSWKTVS